METTITKKKRAPRGTYENTGRPKAELDWDEIADLLRVGVPAQSIADGLGIERTTLYNRCAADNNMTFSTWSQQQRAGGDHSLHRKQFETAMEGDKTMLIWLGKQRLGQSDKNETTQVQKFDTVSVLAGMLISRGLATPETLAQTIQELPFVNQPEDEIEKVVKGFLTSGNDEGR